MSTGSARRFVRMLNRTPSTAPTTIGGEFELEAMRRMEQRGIVSGVVDSEPEPDRRGEAVRALLEDRRWQDQYAADRAQREAEEEAEPPLTLPEQLTQAIGGGAASGHLALNGLELLQAALGGSGGTINGGRPA